MASEWIKIVNKNGFIGIKEPWCNNQGVAILPFIKKDDEYYFLQIHETNPLLDENKIGKYSTITGDLENLDCLKTVHTELEEEVGITLSKITPIYSLGCH